ncbi:MAG: hypothetical protein QM328_15510, partial [Acidobacteriota bacterium]|nr:hypothetical protein [Acidobacteriota bacterium]
FAEGVVAGKPEGPMGGVIYPVRDGTKGGVVIGDRLGEEERGNGRQVNHGGSPFCRPTPRDRPAVDVRQANR